MKGLVFDTENRIQLKDFGEPLLDNLQKEVGGYIEVVHPKYLPEGLCMVVDDEGLLKGSPVNNIASILYGTPEHGQPIAGNAVILGEGFVDGERDFVSLTEDDKTNLMAKAFESDNTVSMVDGNGEIITEPESMPSASEQPELHTGKPDVGDGQGALPHGDISQGEPTTVETVVDLSSL